MSMGFALCATPAPVPTAELVRLIPPRYVWHCAACVSMVWCAGGLRCWWGEWLWVGVLQQRQSGLPGMNW